MFKERIYGSYGQVTIGTKSFKVEVADTPEKQIAGLAGRKFLNGIDGMLFVFGEPAVEHFTMKGMEFPLDFIWIKDGKIIDITSNAPPDKGEADYAAKYGEVTEVLELPAGIARRYSFDLGQRVKIELPDKSN